MKAFKKLVFLKVFSLVLALGTPAAAASYYGGGLIPHGHTKNSDGGVLGSFTSLGTITAPKVEVSTLSVKYFDNILSSGTFSGVTFVNIPGKISTGTFHLIYVASATFTTGNPIWSLDFGNDNSNWTTSIFSVYDSSSAVYTSGAASFPKRLHADYPWSGSLIAIRCDLNFFTLNAKAMDYVECVTTYRDSSGVLSAVANYMSATRINSSRTIYFPTLKVSTAGATVLGWWRLQQTSY